MVGSLVFGGEVVGEGGCGSLWFIAIVVVVRLFISLRLIWWRR